MQQPLWTDIGVNLTDHAFSADLEEVVSRAEDAGVKRMIVTGTSLAESEAAVALCQHFPDTLWCTAGVHPHDAKHFDSATERALRDLYQEPCVIAVGETGLDFNRNFSPPEAQAYAFEKQLELATETNLPLFLHERDAFKTQFEMLKAYRDHVSGAVAHCFTGDKAALFGYLDLDLYIGITGWICDERRGAHLLPLLKEIPADRLLLETDAPYLLPRDLKPKPKSRRNEPAHLAHIAQEIVRQTSKSVEQISEETEANVTRLFPKLNR